MGEGVKIAAYFLAALTFLTACSNPKDQLKVAATAVPHAELLEFVKPDLMEKGINLQIIVVEDYNIPNRALAEKEVDANFFQHIPFLEQQIAQFHYPIESLAKIEIEPMGLYSKKIKNISELKEGSKIAIPNDPTNEARALALLDKYGIIKLDNPKNLRATVLNIASNPKKLKFEEIDASMLSRTLPDVDAAVINANFALQANLNPMTDALLREGPDSPYANIIAIRIADVERQDLKELKAAMTSEKMRDYILTKYKGAIQPAF